MNARWEKTAVLFLGSQCVTLFGSTLVQMAIVWYVTLQTGSGAWVAAFSVAAYLPQFLISFAGGIWADRYHKKRLIAGADVAIAALTGLMILLMPLLGERLMACLLALTALRSLGAGIQTPAVYAALPQLVPKAELMRYNGLNASMQAVVNFAAPLTAGLLLAQQTLRAVLLVDVVTAVFGVGLLLRLSLNEAEQEHTAATWESGSRAPFRVIVSQAALRRLLVLYGFFTFLCVPGGYLAGLYVRRTFAASYWVLSLVEVVGFLGMLAGGIVISRWGSRWAKQTMLVAALSAFGVLNMMLGAAAQLAGYLSVMFLYGVAMVAVQTTITTMLQETAAPEHQGRVFGCMSSIYAGALPVGMALFGPLSDWLPLQAIMVGAGCLLLGSAARLVMVQR